MKTFDTLMRAAFPAVLVLVGLFPGSGFSKGITGLQTEAQKAAEAAKDKAAGTSDRDGKLSNEADEVDEGAVKTPAEAAAAKKEGDREPTGETAAVKHAPDLSGPAKGAFHAGLGFAAAKVGSASTHTLMAAEAGLGLKFAQVSSGSGVWGTFRYASHEFDAIQDDISYRGVAEVFALGGLFRSQLSNTIEISAGAEAGLLKLGVRDLTGFERDPQIAKNGVYLGFTGGLDWIYSERTVLGPKIVAGFGRMRVVGLGVSSGYLF